MEPLSAASSVFAVVSLAIELPTAIQNLVQFCRSFKDASEDVKALTGELDTFAIMLSQVHQPGRDSKFDAIIDMAVHVCNGELLRLRKSLGGLVPDLHSPSSRKRARGALKTVMKKPHIEAMRSSLEKVKTTLMLVKTISIESSVESHFERQNQLLLDIMRLVEGPVDNPFEDGIQIPTSRRGRAPPGPAVQAQALQSPDSLYGNGNLNEDSKIGINLVYQKQTCSVKVGEMGVDDEDIRAGKNTTVRRRNFVAGSKYIGDWRLSWSTPFGEVQEGTVQRCVSRGCISDPVEVEYCKIWRVYPNKLLSVLGVRGALVERATDGWQYNIQTFNAVPEDAQIFKFCREGDLEGVRASLKLGLASVRDRDPQGRTPLWIACQALQFEVAEFLLRERSDIHAGDWAQGTPRPPILAIQDNFDPDAQKKSSMISLFERHHPGSFEPELIYTLIGRLIMFYRPNKPIGMSLQWRREAALMLVKQLSQLVGSYFKDEENVYSHIARCMLCFSVEQSPLQWALRKVNVTILEKNTPSSRHMLHEAFLRYLPFSDPVSMRLITEKSENLHFRWYSDYDFSSVYKDSTPTTLALYHPELFAAWKSLLAGQNMAEFVERELQDSPLSKEGWNKESLLFLFESDIPLEPRRHPTKRAPCDRCGNIASLDWNPLFHLPWRRHLRALRAGDLRSYQTPTTEDNFVSVCSHHCRDWFCATGIYENNLTDDEISYGPAIPDFISAEDRELQKARAAEIAHTECPSKKMPGAYVE